LAAGQSALWNSSVFAVLAASVCSLVGLTLWRWAVGASLWIVFLLPGVLLGIALIYLLNRPPLTALYQSSAVVVLALALRYAAVAWSGTRHAMRSVDSTLTDFARCNGASRWQMLWHVHWPQIAPEVGAVWLVTYLFCLWDVETLVLIIPPGRETLALRIFNLLHYGHNAQVNALCLLLVGLAAWPLVLWAAARMWSARALTASAGMGLVVLSMAATGCDRIPSNQARIQSKLFGTVEVIGSRGTALGQFNKPRSVAIDAHDNCYVVDMTGRVQKFSSNGVYLLSWQMPQTEKGKPKGMCRDAMGNIMVIEPHYARVNHFSPEGKLLRQWGEPGTNSGQLCLPRAMAVNAHGDLWVCEYTQVDRVQRFSAEGRQWQLGIGKSGRRDGEFNRPEGLGVDAQNRLYVADSCNHRIQVFSPEGKFLYSYGRAGRGLGELSYPYDVQVDATGLQFVVEFGNSRIQVFDPEGKPMEIIGGPGSAPGQFGNPWSEAFDSAGNLYVVDSQNHRVQKFIRRAPLSTVTRKTEHDARAAARPTKLPNSADGPRTAEAGQARLTAS
jgi:ABC-type spermidine/putrescine transport system permease subunit II/sugar lactone lactonase YvrE